MKSITFDKFDIGLDLRKGASVSDPSRMRDLKNAYVTIGKVLRKRPGLQLIETFTGSETGTIGLVAGNGFLNTFREDYASPWGHANTLFKMNRVAHPVSAVALDTVLPADVFNGYLYGVAEYVGGDKYHHYLDTEEEETYDAGKSYNLGDYVKGNAVSNKGVRQRCTTASARAAITATSVANNTVVSAIAHGLSAGGIARISGADGTFTQVAIDRIEVGNPCRVFTASAHGYTAGNSVLIAGVSDGEYSAEINGIQIVANPNGNYFEIAGLICYEEGSTGVIGVTSINGEFEVLASPAPTANTFAIAVKCTVSATTGTVGKPAGTEPAWNATVGGTATCGDTVTVFTAESTAIADTSCPHSSSFAIAASKIFAIDGPVVRFCSLNNPRVWDATLRNLPGGFLPVSSHAKGSSDTTAVGQYDGRLAAFLHDSVQFWNVDANPANDSYYKSVEGVGTKFPQTVREFAGDVFFLAESGIRSVTTLQFGNQNLAESDVGSAIDKLVVEQVKTVANPVAEFFTGMGQYWCMMRGIANNPVWAFTYSRTQKISAWAYYEFLKSDGAGGTTPLLIDAIAVNAGKLYLRSDESVYKVNPDVFTDNGELYEMYIEFPFIDFKLPGHLKYVASMDVVFKGSCDVQFKFDPNDDTLITDKIRLTGDTRQKASIPLEMTVASLAPVFSDLTDQDVEIEAITFYYEDLGPISG